MEGLIPNPKSTSAIPFHATASHHTRVFVTRLKIHMKTSVKKFPKNLWQDDPCPHHIIGICSKITKERGKRIYSLQVWITIAELPHLVLHDCDRLLQWSCPIKKLKQSTRDFRVLQDKSPMWVGGRNNKMAFNNMDNEVPEQGFYLEVFQWENQLQCLVEVQKYRIDANPPLPEWPPENEQVIKASLCVPPLLLAIHLLHYLL